MFHSLGVSFKLFLSSIFFYSYCLYFDDLKVSMGPLDMSCFYVFFYSFYRFQIRLILSQQSYVFVSELVSVYVFGNQAQT